MHANVCVLCICTCVCVEGCGGVTGGCSHEDQLQGGNTQIQSDLTAESCLIYGMTHTHTRVQLSHTHSTQHKHSQKDILHTQGQMKGTDKNSQRRAD